MKLHVAQHGTLLSGLQTPSLSVRSTPRSLVL
jgi:hypothetical protein